MDQVKGEPTPDRPLECTECKRKVKIHYKQMIGERPQTFAMCEECPVLYRKLHGRKNLETSHFTGENIAGLCCGNCQTTLASFRMSQKVGCVECYEVFEDPILEALIRAKKIPEKLVKKGKAGPLHIGKTPGEISPVNPSLRLAALNEALNETLGREDYEQAAWIRDQIKKLMEQNPNG